MERTPVVSPFVLVIFGATGDLMQRKLLPSLYHLYRKQMLPKHFFIIGFSRRKMGVVDFKEFLKDAIKKHDARHTFEPSTWKTFRQKLYYQQGDFDEIFGYNQLIDKLKRFDDLLNACVPRFFYLATPPDKYETILNFLRDTKLSEGCGQGSDKWTKILIEKPFGRSLSDAKSLDSKLAHLFKEDQIYRIDHYLGKETVQNIIAFRYGNTIFDPVWNRQFIDHFQITIAEDLGIETRGNFYEGVGALRDMAQSHLLELMTAVTMHRPESLDTRSIRTSRAKTIELIESIKPQETRRKTVRGQYGSSKDGKVKGYRQEVNVSRFSNTETYVALKLTLNDLRWNGVPFYLRTGKRLMRKTTDISVIFKEPELKLFGRNTEIVANTITFHIEPNEGIELTLNAKKVGLTTVFETVPMSFTYPRGKELAEPYERLLLDAMRGEQLLFARTDEVASAWKLISNIAQGWENQGAPKFPNYTAGSWGPKEAGELIERDGRQWLLK